MVSPLRSKDMHGGHRSVWTSVSTPSKKLCALALALTAVGAVTVWPSSMHGDTARAALRANLPKPVALPKFGQAKCGASLDPEWGLAEGVDFFKLRSQSRQDGVLAYLFQVGKEAGGGCDVP